MFGELLAIRYRAASAGTASACSVGATAAEPPGAARRSVEICYSGYRVGRRISQQWQAFYFALLRFEDYRDFINYIIPIQTMMLLCITASRGADVGCAVEPIQS